MKFLFIKGDSLRNVRLNKFISCLTRIGHAVSFWGWDRASTNQTDDRLAECRYLCSGGEFGKSAIWRYPIWMCKVFWAVLFRRGIKECQIVAVNFDSALPVCLAGLIRRVRFIYEIRDEFALSYNFPSWLKRCILAIDHWIIRRARFVLHVDTNRITYDKGKFVVIENAPEDYWNGRDRSYANMRPIFAVVGNLSHGRGLKEICKFAKRNKHVTILVAGTLYDQESRNILKTIENMIYKERMPQKELFRCMENCCGIFSLYDPSLEINRLAASNKVYDAMMMGIPVITNKDVQNSKYIHEMGVGIIVDYEYNESWRALESKDFMQRAVRIGSKGRQLYLAKYQFDRMIEERFIPAVLKYS